MNRTYAAVDLGSNSFHLLVVSEVDGSLHVIDKLRERVRLAGALQPDHTLDPTQWAPALATLEQFRQRLTDVPAHRVRAVGTNTLRKAINREAFTRAAEAALGHPIEVISGAEEARLVYRGVAHDLEDSGESRLVVDIGGGSTECVVGQGLDLLRTDSLYMGCVEFTRRFFPDQRITPERMDEAVVAARLELGAIHRAYRDLGWRYSYGSSGTINAVQQVLTQSGKSEHCITPEGLEWLFEQVVKAKRIPKLRLSGLKPDRAAVFPGGVCILMAIFRSLKIDKMVASNSALREGVIYDLLGRRIADVRDQTVRRMRDRYAADPRHAKRVEQLALSLVHQFAGPFDMDLERATILLRWACHLHEIGKAISYTGYHRHGAYLISNSDMPGFSRSEKKLVAALVLGQRRRLIPERLAELVGSGVDEAIRLCIILRLASRLTRTRSSKPRPHIDVRVDGRAIHLDFPPGWLDARPLTQGDLAMEAQAIGNVGFELSWS